MNASAIQPPKKHMPPRAATSAYSLPLLLALAACGNEDGRPAGDAGTAISDGGADSDAAVDAGAVLDASTGPDGGAVDAVGTISGSCGELDDTELLSTDPFYFKNVIALSGFTADDESRLSAGAQQILMEGTAGGSSALSEAFSFEVLHRCEGASLLKSERFIVYEPAESTRTDLLVEIDGHRIGVSVTRAVGFPRTDPYTVERARMLLEDKLGDILVSSMNVVDDDRWVKQILHVIAYAEMHADSIMAAWAMLAPSVRADTILWVTVTDGDDGFLY